MKLQLSLRNNKQVKNESAAANDSKHIIKQRMSIMTNEHTHMLAYWFLSYIELKSSSIIGHQGTHLRQHLFLPSSNQRRLSQPNLLISVY